MVASIQAGVMSLALVQAALVSAFVFQVRAVKALLLVAEDLPSAGEHGQIRHWHQAGGCVYFALQSLPLWQQQLRYLSDIPCSRQIFVTGILPRIEHEVRHQGAFSHPGQEIHQLWYQQGVNNLHDGIASRNVRHRYVGHRQARTEAAAQLHRA